MAMKPVSKLEVGQFVTPRHLINHLMVSHWKFSHQCAHVGGGILPGARLEISEINPLPGQAWVKLQIHGRDPPSFLKVTREELAGNFDLI